MLNAEATALSLNNIENQIQYIKTKRPYIKAVCRLDNSPAIKADYLHGVDAVGIGIDGRNYNIQFKTRQKGNNDFVLIAKRLTGNTIESLNLGFRHGDYHYAFDLEEADIFVENIGGKNYNISREEINAIEEYMAESLYKYISGIQPRYFYKDNGDKIFSGDYYVFIKPEKLNELRSILHGLSL